jgi:TonB family protein
MSAPPRPLPPPTIQGHTGTGAFSSRLVIVKDDLVARAYQAGLRARFATSPTVDADVSGVLESIANGVPLPYSNVDFLEGDFAGTWEFIDPPNDEQPMRAWRNIDRSDVDGYSAERIGYCRDSRVDCTAWFEAGRHRSASPQASAGDKAEAEWKSRVMQEPCQPNTELRPGLVSLQSVIARSGMTEARVVLLLLLNPCGEVRDASVAVSSRDRNVDSAAIRWARRARFVSTVQDLASFGNSGVLAKLPFSFTIEP